MYIPLQRAVDGGLAERLRETCLERERQHRRRKNALSEIEGERERGRERGREGGRGGREGVGGERKREVHVYV